MSDAQRGRRSLGRRAVVAALAVCGSLLSLPTANAHAEDVVGSYIVQSPAGVASALTSVGAVANRSLPLVSGAVADLTALQLAALQQVPTVSVVPNLPITMNTSDGTVQHAPSAVFPQVTGATGLTGVSGVGIGVGILDTGIAPLPDFAGRLVGGVDLSGEGNPYLDSFGHGTFVAGLAAGNGASSAGQYAGEAPGANLVAIKVSGASGLTDMGTVIEGIAWAVDHRLAYNLRVLNLSLGAPQTLSASINPLDQAVEAAWNAGITVVTTAGNSGNVSGSITSPGDDPLVLTVGATDDLATVSKSDDGAPWFSGAGPTLLDGLWKPDLVASGRSVVSLRVPGSTLDVAHPSARVGSANFVGSGTSFSSAITSGAVAMLLQTNPLLTPSQVKARLLYSAAPGPTGNPFVDGHGQLDVYAAATAPAVNLLQTPAVSGLLPWATASSAAAWSQSTWNRLNWIVPLGAPAPATTQASADRGTGGTGAAGWNGTAWNGTAWNGTAWNGTAWNGTAWNGTAWNGTAWNGTAWT